MDISNTELEKSTFEEIVTDFPKDVSDAFTYLATSEDLYLSSFYYDDDVKSISLQLENCDSYVRTLILHNATGGLKDVEYDSLSFDYCSLIKNPTGYSLVGKAFNFTDEADIPFSIYFTDATVEIKLFNAKTNQFHTPWSYIQFMATDILAKNELSPDYLNEKEKTLIPLLTEIMKLTYWNLTTYTFNSEIPCFPQFKSYLHKYNYIKLVKKVKKLESFKPDKNNYKKYFSISSSLFTELNRLPYKPLWTEIKELILDSQNDYEDKVSYYCSADMLDEARTHITKELHELGYEGTYPLFSKRGSLKGLKLYESYDMSYLSFFEKDVYFYIHLTEHYIADNLVLKFNCMGERIKKGKAPLGADSCLFNDNGHRYYFSLLYTNDLTKENKIDHLKLSQIITISVKKAELKKLTKEERKEYIGFEISYFAYFIFNFIFMGGLFSIPFTILFILFTIISAFLAGEAAKIPSLILDPIWLIMIPVAWLLYGGIMSLITVFSKKM